MLIEIGQHVAAPSWFAADAAVLVTALVTSVGGLFALFKWRDDAKWKRIVVAFERIRSFDETPETRNAIMILKSPKRPIPFYIKIGVARLFGRYGVDLGSATATSLRSTPNWRHGVGWATRIDAAMVHCRA